MTSFRFKIKGYLNETGEYSELHNADHGTILHFILQHWFNESLPNNLDIIFIQNESGDQLIIDHLKRDIFDYYFIDKKKSKGYFHKKTDIQFMYFVLESFFNNRLQDLRHNFNETADEWSFIRGDFSGKDFSYSVTNKKIWKNVDALLFPLIVVLGASVVSFFTSFIVLIIGLVFCVIFAFGMYSTLRRLQNYYDDNKDITVKISRGDDFLHLKKGSWSRSIPKTDIRNILKYTAPLDDPRSVTEYHTEIEFLNGNILNITSLLLPQNEIEHKFANDLVPIEFKVMEGNDLPRKTNLDKYFSAVRPVGAHDPVS